MKGKAVEVFLQFLATNDVPIFFANRFSAFDQVISPETGQPAIELRDLD
jgi:hypothetical protein